MTIQQRINKIDSKRKEYHHFIPRVTELRAIEGWYFDHRIKISCKWNDILRAADSKHFKFSCFSTQGFERLQPIKRLYHPDFAVIMMLDRAGNVQSRAYTIYQGMNKDKDKVKLSVCKIQGNGLTMSLIKQSLHDVAILEEMDDIYL